VFESDHEQNPFVQNNTNDFVGEAAYPILIRREILSEWRTYDKYNGAANSANDPQSGIFGIEKAVGTAFYRSILREYVELTSQN
jgi:hypothetical protein